jgi:hypothetical protein
MQNANAKYEEPILNRDQGDLSVDILGARQKSAGQ